MLVAANPARVTVEVYVATRNLPAGASLGPDSLVLARVTPGSGLSLLFGSADESALTGMRASHDLIAGQLIQRSDVMDASSSPDRRLVFLPVKDVPTATAGSKVDLLLITGTADHPTVSPFALGVEVRSAVAGGLVVVVTSRQAAAFVYAATTMRLAAAIAEPGSAAGGEVPISTRDQAIAAAEQQ